MTETDRAAMRYLLERDDSEEVTPGRIARALHLSPASGTALIDRLVARGLVVVHGHPHDRRKKLVRPLDGDMDLDHLDPLTMRLRSLAAKLTSGDARIVATFLEDVLATVTHATAPSQLIAGPSMAVDHATARGIELRRRTGCRALHRRLKPMREFVRGVALLGRGFATWRRRPGLMMLGLLPAAIVGALFLTGLIVLSASLPGLTDAMTPFADGWPCLWATVFRIAVGTALLGAALVLVVVTFTAVTLLVGDPFYERIWRAVETDAGAAPLDARYGFWRSVADGLSLIGRGLGVALLAALIGLVPVVGGALSAVFGVTLTGWLVADELTSRAFTARGMARPARRRADAPPPRSRAGLRRRHAAHVPGAARGRCHDAGRRRRCGAAGAIDARRDPVAGGATAGSADDLGIRSA